MSNPEKVVDNHEIKDQKGLEEAGNKQREVLEENREKELSRENPKEQLEKVTKEALEKAQSKEKEQPPQEVKRETSPAERRGAPTSAETDASFNATMKEVRSQMSPSSRAFSKVIHNKTVEKVSEATGNTIARPNAILAGAVAAFLLTLIVYIVAKHFGYPLSGFETIAAFALGWVLGVAYDFLRVMITGRSAR